MKSERKRLSDRLDELCKQIVRIRDDNTCQNCGKEVHGHNAHTCHVVAKGNGASWRRFDLLNIFVGCCGCHQWGWHINPIEFNPWFAKKFPARYKYLEKYRNHKVAKISNIEMAELVVKYKIKLAELKKGF